MNKCLMLRFVWPTVQFKPSEMLSIHRQVKYKFSLVFVFAYSLFSITTYTEKRVRTSFITSSTVFTTSVLDVSLRYLILIKIRVFKYEYL
jgi:hypothetical protein